VETGGFATDTNGRRVKTRIHENFCTFARILQVPWVVIWR